MNHCVSERHNHQRCIDDALERARALCRQRGARLTPNREQILTLVWANHQPVGAYSLIDALAEQGKGRITPPTVYRALDFLLEQGLIHRIASLNAFIGCADPQHHHQGHFLICRHCKTALELEDDSINQAISHRAQAQGFGIHHQCVEIIGCCQDCQEQGHD